MKDTDFSLVFGAGVAFPIGESALDLEVRYALGLRNLDEEEDIDAKSRAIVILAGFRF